MLFRPIMIAPREPTDETELRLPGIQFAMDRQRFERALLQVLDFMDDKRQWVNSLRPFFEITWVQIDPVTRSPACPSGLGMHAESNTLPADIRHGCLPLGASLL